MRTIKNIISIGFMMALVVLITGFGPSKDSNSNENELYQTIVELDSVFFTAYNNCDLKTAASLISENLEFYHDQGGLSTSKTEIVEALEKNICGKVTRELVEGSIEISEIPGFGAVQIGMHKFYNSEEPNAISKPGRFVTLWKKTGESWQMTRVISLHNN